MRTRQAKGFVSDRCELNRQIRKDNALLRELKAQVQKLLKTLKDTIPVIAKAMERVRMKMLILSYQGIRTRSFIQRNKDSLRSIRPRFNRYTEIAAKLKELLTERKALLAEKKELSPLKIGEHRRLSQRIATLTEDVEELKSEKTRILSDLHRADDSEMKEVKKWVTDMETELQKAETVDARFSAELDAALAEYHGLEEKSAGLDQTELWAARLELRPETEKEDASKVQDAYGIKYDPAIMDMARVQVKELSGEKWTFEQKRSIQEVLRKNKAEGHGRENQPQRRRRPREQER